MSGKYTRLPGSYTPQELMRGLRNLAQIGIVNAREDIPLLLAAADCIEILQHYRDSIIKEKLAEGKITPNEIRKLYGLTPISEDEHLRSGLLEE